jgi:hypothetical protein
MYYGVKTSLHGAVSTLENIPGFYILVVAMAGQESRYRELPPREVRAEFTKRKIRKGTQSCWECKRKKIKCTFTTPTDSVCHGCKRRGTQCISQEFPEGETTSPKQLGDRLGRVEELVGQLLKETGQSTQKEPSHLLAHSKSSTVGDGQRYPVVRGKDSRYNDPAAAFPDNSDSLNVSSQTQEIPVSEFNLVKHTCCHDILF